WWFRSGAAPQPEPGVFWNTATAKGEFGENDSLTQVLSTTMGHYIVFDPEFALGDFVWEDIDGDGIQDEGEPGMKGISVWLYQGPTDALVLVGQTHTNSDGRYVFVDIMPDTSYQLKFHLSEGYGLTVANAGDDDNKDSDAMLVMDHVKIYPVMLGSEEQNFSHDVGIVMVENGDFV
ncbi:MAG: hypothetical protein GTO62_19870, partial [Planctomycetales bacterium]|nr:hypothetical protein [Planctomycetales bacterium]